MVRWCRPGRKLLFATDDAFNFYRNRYPNKSIMVCKECDASGLTGVDINKQAGDFRIWVFCSGLIVNNVSTDSFLYIFQHSNPYSACN